MIVVSCLAKQDGRYQSDKAVPSAPLYLYTWLTPSNVNPLLFVPSSVFLHLHVHGQPLIPAHRMCGARGGQGWKLNTRPAISRKQIPGWSMSDAAIWNSLST
jgi:hypothetical protein